MFTRSKVVGDLSCDDVIDPTSSPSPTLRHGDPLCDEDAGNVEATKHRIARGGLAPWQQRSVTNYIEEHLSERISLNTLASLVNLSRYYFCRAFTQSLGIPPLRYCNRRRIERAKALLTAQSLTVTEIGYQLGFADTSSFGAVFRKPTGVTPTAYRRNVS